jgi:hypothetical protein
MYVIKVEALIIEQNIEVTTWLYNCKNFHIGYFTKQSQDKPKEHPESSPDVKATTLDLERWRLALNTSNNLTGSILGDDFIIVQHLKLLSCISTHEVHESLRSTWVLVQPVGDVHDDTLDHYPQVFLGVVLGDLLHGVLLLGHLELGWFGWLADLSWVGGISRAALHHWTSGGLRLLGLLIACASLVLAVPLDGDFPGLRGVDVQGDLAKTRGGAEVALEGVLEEVAAGGVTGDTSVDNTAE